MTTNATTTTDTADTADTADSSRRELRALLTMLQECDERTVRQARRAFTRDDLTLSELTEFHSEGAVRAESRLRVLRAAAAASDADLLAVLHRQLATGMRTGRSGDPFVAAVADARRYAVTDLAKQLARYVDAAEVLAHL